MHSFFFIYISNSHSLSHFYIRSYLLLLLLLLSPDNLFTFLPLNALLPFKLRRDAAVATSRRVWYCVGT